jgi:hypothetical protein
MEGSMATVIIATDPVSSIDYSVVNGRVREFVLRGKILKDENQYIEIDGWKEQLADFIIEQQLHIDKDGHGLHAFVNWIKHQTLRN